MFYINCLQLKLEVNVLNILGFSRNKKFGLKPVGKLSDNLRLKPEAI